MDRAADCLGCNFDPHNTLTWFRLIRLSLRSSYHYLQNIIIIKFVNFYLDVFSFLTLYKVGLESKLCKVNKKD